ncbi:MAG: CinA family protein [Chloroflexota bacterium]
MVDGTVDFGALVELAERVGQRLKARGETIAVAESSAGGLISAALLAVPGASGYFVGGAVVYTRVAKEAALHLTEADLATPRASTEGHALVLARGALAVHGTTWGLGETGATGPTGNRYGDAAGHACIAVAGPVDRTLTLETASPDRVANMGVFAMTALQLLSDVIPA